MKRHDVKWQVLRAADGLGLRNHEVAKAMGISPQCFCYRLKHGFSTAEIIQLRGILKEEKIGVLCAVECGPGHQGEQSCG